MSVNGKIAVIGDKDSVLAFKAVGADTFGAQSMFETNDLLRRFGGASGGNHKQV